MNIIDNTFNLHNRLLNNNNRYMKVTLKSELVGVANFRRILNLHMAYKTGKFKKIFLLKKSVPYAVKYGNSIFAEEIIIFLLVYTIEVGSKLADKLLMNLIG